MSHTSAQSALRSPHSAPRERPEPRGESALRAAILDALGEAVVASDTDGRIIYWNEAAQTLYGWTAAEALGADLAGLLSAEGWRGDALTILRHLRAGRSWSGEFFVRHREGHAFPIHATTTPVRDARGSLVGMVGIARDLSAQRQAEEALRRTEERLELVHRAATSVIWEWDLRTLQRQWNDSVADVFGYGGAEVLPSEEWWQDRIHPEDRDRVTEGLTSTLEDGRRFWTDEYRFRRGDGTYATVFDRAYVAVDRNGRPVRVVGTMLDLTERRRSHEATRFLAQTSMLLDLSLDYAAVLPGIARLATQTVADGCILLVGSPRSIEEVIAAGADTARDEALQRITTRLAAGALTGTITERVLTRGESMALPDVDPTLLPDRELDDDVRRAASDAELPRVVVAPMLARGATVGVVVLGWGPEHPPPAEDQVRVAQELGRRVGVAVDNARLFHSAELARRAKTDFLSVISHELRTPLTAVMGYADLLAAQIGGALNETQRKQVERIRTGADKLLRVIEGILAYARLEAGQERAQLERVPLERVLGRVRDVVVPHAAERGVRFTVDTSAAAQLVCVDVEKTSHVLVALLINAVKFSGTGGACALRVAGDDAEITFDVSDTGPGIGHGDLPHLFNPFWQAEQPEVRRAGGSGLGLSVARRLARLMGGEVAVLDTSAEGTTFRLTLLADPET